MTDRRLQIGILAGVIGIVVVAIGAVVTFPLWRPLFVDDVVDEAFPEQALEQQSLVDQLPEEQQIQLTEMSGENAVPAVEAEATTVSEPTILTSGSFIELDALHGADGSANIYELPDGSRVLRFEDFRATNGPDLFIVLSTHDAPTTSAEVGEYLDLGRLKGNVGNQNYDIPAGVDLSQYRSVVIYCVAFQVVFSTATLNA